MNQHIIQKAKETIAIEAAAIQRLSGFVDEQFEATVQAIYQSKGRIVVTGIGKSAIVAQKIVATLNSTGTPALFMHAADAIHGDLGMVQRDDMVMIVSKSGESPEIKVLVPFIKNFGNPVIALVGATDSFLAKEAQFIVPCSVEKEACPNNLAPTSSTTAQMVMGDALAVALMTLNGFDGKDFAKYHPGGNLGKRLYLKVADVYVHNPQPKVLPNASLKEVIVEITQKRLGATAVVQKNNTIIGIITDGDLRRMLNKSSTLENINAADILTPQPKTIAADTLAVEALEVLKKYDISQLIVAENNTYLGIIHLHDLVREGII
ncbi:MAG: KpsF/GutQ family sugar-phosphate isomerase [Hydrotalea flava]|jgi:arabinose-5-phosphate isomerase|uniref:KpsF/GutQ family sugar-phosphate isomerase n=1 Tax=Hydrotalea TaxID=1004300 RepID=UPI0009454090|nr:MULTISPECIES: KpsF/GutQ family sugar-phosphate isomerase [Hydrotalea]MBY0348519.1 KpsF/GutQ family sugar-phosphate isomerase [Hydrotalea flava]RWZ87636.1 MAG: KpsF/GutQ family sugar-phosphate isomerase [Hydrotalea sp. AMD]